MIAGEPDFVAHIGSQLEVAVYVEAMSVNDPYVIFESAVPDSVCVIINHTSASLPLGDSVVDAVAEVVGNTFRSLKLVEVGMTLVGAIDPDTVKTFKDGLLRIALEIQEHEDAAAAE